MTKCNKRNSCMGYYGDCLDVKITNACNAKCSFCIEKDGYCPKASDINKLINAVNMLTNYTKVLILGGEPLMCKDLELFLAGIRSKKEKIYITTNGSLLDSNIAERLAQYLDGINISIHHFAEYKNDEVYGIHVDFSKIKEAIEVFHEYEIPVRINCNLIKDIMETKESADMMIDFVKNYLNADEIRFNELQNAEDEFVDARKIFCRLTDNPFCNGCEQSVEGYDFNVRVKQTCGCVNKKKEPVKDPEPSAGKTKVAYPSGEIFDLWVKKEEPSFETKKPSFVDEFLESMRKPRSCHSGCH